MEKYEGVKFRAIKVPGGVPGACASRLLAMDATLKGLLSPSANEGNLSVLCGKGFVIKGTGSKLTLLKKEDLAYVASVNESDFSLSYSGALPSSESFMHHFIYRSVPASAILHFHGDSLLSRKPSLPFVPKLPYGSPELANAVSSKAKEGKIILMEGHGFIIWAEKDHELIPLLKSIL
ncbi:MAG: class II aldolase/adducin family protein [Candidatus Micrarchaeia archaeon]|jgi:ribulose-5-phosphate 4-epimerase/fuculose-1-phosphate aldolase